MSDDLPFFNHLGEVEYIPGYPLSFGDWAPSDESVDPKQQELISDVSRVLNKIPTKSHVRALNLNLVCE